MVYGICYAIYIIWFLQKLFSAGEKKKREKTKTQRIFDRFKTTYIIVMSSPTKEQLVEGKSTLNKKFNYEKELILYTQKR